MDIPPDDIRERLFAQQDVRNTAKPRPGSDVERTVVVTLREAYRGTTRLVEQAGGRRFEVQIPPGVATGTRVRFTGYGKRGNSGGIPGDLYLLIEVRPHPSFARRGADLDYQCTLNLAELALGTEVRIRTLNGRILIMTVPAGTQPGQRFRLAGQGMPQLGQPDQRGDLYVTVNAKLTHMRDATSVPNDSDWQTDEIIGLVIVAVMFVVGIGAGLLLYWLIID